MNDDEMKKEAEQFHAWFEGWADPNVGIVEWSIQRLAAWSAWRERAEIARGKDGQ
jgi:hypothetical protein